ncbi:LrgA family protein [Acidovorax delafieldii 2AN]|uniref:LrgA family protein n=1 Tax=Acidovorax delafieldii 2AN TaxID=573060 RepID=C5T7K5_ACIDE|nr:CidA/LrgA family protein [Acidovorax delafieldii]EER59536.1 LrgA family protein [Acidovorax delafieldii 2AN]
MLYAFAALFCFQLLGEALVRLLGLPLPGALMGMLLLLAAIAALGRVPEALERTASGLLQNMMLLFIPAIVGVMLHFERIAREWLPFLAAGMGGAAVTLVVTACTLRWLLRKQPAAGECAP